MKASFASDARAIETAVAAAIRFGHATGLPLETHAKLAVIVEELVSNIVEHGAAGGRPIDLVLTAEPGFVRVTLGDGGRFFDPRLAVQAPVPPDRGGGAGIALVLAWSRITAYTRIGERNHLELLLPRDG